MGKFWHQALISKPIFLADENVPTLSGHTKENGLPHLRRQAYDGVPYVSGEVPLS